MKGNLECSPSVSRSLSCNKLLDGTCDNVQLWVICSQMLILTRAPLALQIFHHLLGGRTSPIFCRFLSFPFFCSRSSQLTSVSPSFYWLILSLFPFLAGSAATLHSLVSLVLTQGICGRWDCGRGHSWSPDHGWRCISKSMKKGQLPFLPQVKVKR